MLLDASTENKSFSRKTTAKTNREPNHTQLFQTSFAEYVLSYYVHRLP